MVMAKKENLQDFRAMYYLRWHDRLPLTIKVFVRIFYNNVLFCTKVDVK